MRVALKDAPIARNDPPSGMVQATLNGATEWVKNEDLDRMQEFDFEQQDQSADDAAFDIF
jgi:penicillin-binding protein 1A